MDLEATTAAIRRQLETLGHFDVPDALIQSFLSDSGVSTSGRSQLESQTRGEAGEDGIASRRSQPAPVKKKAEGWRYESEERSSDGDWRLPESDGVQWRASAAPPTSLASSRAPERLLIRSGEQGEDERSSSDDEMFDLRAERRKLNIKSLSLLKPLSQASVQKEGAPESQLSVRTSTDEFLESCARPLSVGRHTKVHVPRADSSGSLRESTEGGGLPAERDENAVPSHRACTKKSGASEALRIPFGIVDANKRGTGDQIDCIQLVGRGYATCEEHMHAQRSRQHCQPIWLDQGSNGQGVRTPVNEHHTKSISGCELSGPSTRRKKQGMNPSESAFCSTRSDLELLRESAVNKDRSAQKVLDTSHNVHNKPGKPLVDGGEEYGIVSASTLRSQNSSTSTSARSSETRGSPETVANKPPLPREARGMPKGEGSKKALLIGPPVRSCKGRTDRVARYAEMRNAWKKDPFLKSTSTKRRAQNFHRIFASQHAQHERECAEALFRPAPPSPSAQGAPPFVVSIAKPQDPVRLPLSALRRHSTV